MNPDLMKDFLLETFPNPERKGCPDDKTLEALAEDRLPAEHPARLHVGSCSECYAEYRHYRLDWEESNAVASTRTPKPFLALSRLRLPTLHESQKLGA